MSATIGSPSNLNNLLYPYYLLDPVTAAINPNMLASGTVVLLPIDMTTILMTQIIVTQVSLTQDFGMRCWLSVYPLGVSLIAPLPDVFALSRMTPRPLIIFVNDQVPPPNSILANVQPGLYYLNILNLTNHHSAFSFTQTNLA